MSPISQVGSVVMAKDPCITYKYILNCVFHETSKKKIETLKYKLNALQKSTPYTLENLHKCEHSKIM